MTVSLFKDAYVRNSVSLYSADKIIESIRDGQSLRDKIADIRQIREIDKDLYERGKRQLPVIVWQGVCTAGRSISSITKLSGLVCLDYNEVPLELKEKIAEKYRWIYCIFISPSGKGLKVIGYCPGMPIDLYPSVVAEMTAIIKEDFGIEVDPRSNSRNQACFASYDPDIYVNPHPRGYRYKGKIRVGNINSLTPDVIMPGKIRPGCEDMEDWKKTLRDLDTYWEQTWETRYSESKYAYSIYQMALTMYWARIPCFLAVRYVKSRAVPCGVPDYRVDEIIRSTYKTEIQYEEDLRLGHIEELRLPTYYDPEGDSYILNKLNSKWEEDETLFEPENLLSGFYKHLWVLYTAGIAQCVAVTTLSNLYRGWLEWNLVYGEVRRYWQNKELLMKFGSWRKNYFPKPKPVVAQRKPKKRVTSYYGYFRYN